jgi:hypothetical protein
MFSDENKLPQCSSAFTYCNASSETVNNSYTPSNCIATALGSDRFGFDLECFAVSEKSSGARSLSWGMVGILSLAFSLCLMSL